MDPDMDRRRILAEAKGVEERAWIVLKVDNALCVVLLFATIFLGVFFFTDPYYGPKAQALRTLNMTVTHMGNRTIDFVSGHPEFLNQTTTLKGVAPVLPSATSFVRSWMNFIYAHKTFYGLISGALIVIQFRYNEGVIRNKLSRFTWWMGFHAFILVVCSFTFVCKAFSSTGVGLDLTFGTFAFLSYRVLMIKFVYDLYALRRFSGTSHMREEIPDIPDDLAFPFGISTKRHPPSGMTYIPAGQFYNIGIVKDTKPCLRDG